MKKKHINDVQTQTVDEHYKLLLEDNSVIDPEIIDVTINNLPDWYDKKLYKKAQNYYKRNMASILIANITGFIITFSVKTIQKVLLYTKQSNSTTLALKRYVETILHMQNLYTYDINDTDSKWYKTMNAIRRHHKISTKRLKNAGIGEISQRDMVFTQYSFAAFVFVMPKSFGLSDTLEEREAFNHFWRVNGYMLGISDKFNLCRKNAKETTELCQKIKDLFVIYLSKPSSEFDYIMSNVLNAFWYFTMAHINTNCAMAYTYELYGLAFILPTIVAATNLD
ncbi:uncharacterized protein LOC105833938 isoform X2 [Monomorium pharaonis]|uniref:uncharacterized protein LOC105833938 isoform X2 n=1 Tax=Monomorium pharaonis TaxID=307658 RepID=UPI001745EEE7|nr:uncharacterized protein LOC105833938 isoform X2 [Monomorium pharaonis]